MEVKKVMSVIGASTSSFMSARREKAGCTELRADTCAKNKNDGICEVTLKMASASFSRVLRKGRALVFGMVHVQALPGKVLNSVAVHYC